MTGGGVAEVADAGTGGAIDNWPGLVVLAPAGRSGAADGGGGVAEIEATAGLTGAIVGATGGGTTGGDTFATTGGTGEAVGMAGGKPTPDVGTGGLKLAGGTGLGSGRLAIAFMHVN